MATSGQPSGVELNPQQRFFHFFQQEITALQEQMDRLSETAVTGGERNDAADHCLAGITRLSNEVKDASSYIPPYDQRTYAEAIKALQEKLDDTRKIFAPKPKFSFKSAHKSPSSLSLSDAAELAAEKRRGAPGILDPGSETNSSFANTPAFSMTPANERALPDGEEEEGTQQDQTSNDQPTNTDSSPSDKDNDRPPLYTTQTSISVTNQTHAHIILPSSSLNTQTPCSLQKLSNCVLDLSIPTTATAPFASLTINNVSSSLLICGSVSGPAHITKVKNSILVVKGRQFRMHDCKNVDVYLHCTSRPIIENCHGIRFTTLPKFHSDLISSSQTAPDATPNQWDQVDDFKWLKAEPSPNWSAMPTEDNIPDDTWREIVPGGPGWHLNDILKAVKLPVEGGGADGH
ncbi:tubulin binding cofactor C-domain-containing protein [Exophiala viscosa]|uniref:Tubulin binding cofactor C-domain-containing protein n=1 Tax=Exophiala viscosa TaxID=2486360 RepID=A0AAN6DQ13_9EURO|nr:tubulin binding cofactor C-domain-containing protein [Exophiala viscosa]KAI1620736.1 tubulin binding cofactor C-domain-containing protein [Exophiala viscosa]